jgi:hypothetical protein
MPHVRVTIGCTVLTLWIASGTAAEQPRVAFTPRPAVMHVLGAQTMANRPRSGDDRFSPIPRAYRLSADGHEYLRELATIQHHPSTAAGDTDRGAQVRRLLIEQAQAIGPLAFFTRHPLERPNVAGSTITHSAPEQWGCSIEVLDPSTNPAMIRTIFADANGCILDMNLSLDASTLFFSYRNRGERCWQIYEIGVDGTGCQRLSTDRTQHDISPVELPSGALMFVSTRAGGQLVSEPGARSNLWVMRRDGSHVRRVSQNTLADLSPQLLPNGQVVFTRWEYVDRDLEYRQGLWTQHPDGTMFQLFFGNTIRDVGIFWQARPVPGHDDVLIATLGPPTGWPQGAIGFVTNRYGPEAERDVGFAWLTDETIPLGDRKRHADGMSYHDMDDGRLLEMAMRDSELRAHNPSGDLSRAHELEASAARWLDAQRPAYRDPCPVNDYLFLATYTDGSGNPFRICLLDVCGNRCDLHVDPTRSCCGVMPLRPQVGFQLAEIRPQSHSMHLSAAETAWGAALVIDIYQGLPAEVRGQAKYVQVMEQLPAIHTVARRAYDQAPVMGYGTYYAKRCWGRAPIESDGSAYFELPALREVYLQVLDAEGRELQRQTSSIQVMAGEQRSCIGCHEPRNQAPSGSPSQPLAAFRPPTRLVAPKWTRDGLPEGLVDFDHVVQPVLNEYCLECHHGADPQGGCDLSSDRTRLFSMAYDNLLGRSRSYRQHNLVTGQMLSQEAARGNPLVHFYWLRRAPTGVNRPLGSGSYISRLPAYLDAAHCQRAVPWEDRQRILVWIDANVPFYADDAPKWPLAPGGRDRFTDARTGEPAAWFAVDFLEVYNRRCADCHDDLPDPNDHENLWDGRMAWLNLTHPEWSPALTAHLSRSAGGRGIPTKPFVDGPDLFPNTEESDYVQILAALRKGTSEVLRTEFIDPDE